MTPNDTPYLVDLEAGEHVVSEVRRHMIVFYARVLFLVVLFFVPLFISPLIVTLIDKLTDAGNGNIIFGFCFTLWLVLLWLIFFFQWTDYYLDVWVITNKRLFDIDQKGAFTREISVFRLEHLQDVTVEVNGIIATFLRFGDVHIHTAGESHDITIRDAANPVAVKNTIMRLHGARLDNEHVPPPIPSDH